MDLPGLRPQGLALSPDGELLITAGKTAELVVVDPSAGTVRQRVPLPTTKAEPRASSANILEPDKEGQLSYTGLRFAPDGRRAFLSDVNGSVVVFDVAADGTIRVARSIRLPAANAPRRKEEIPAGLAVSADGERLYVCGNLSNTLLEVTVADGRVLRTFDVGVAPYDVVLAGGKAYVSNWGGRRPLPGERTGPAGRGTEVQVDPVRHVASEGSVTVIDLESGKTPAGDRDRAPRECPGRVTGRPTRRLRERGQRHPERDRHADRHAWSRRSGRSRARPTSSAPSPTRSPSTRPAGRSTSQRHAERGRGRRVRPGRARVEAAGPDPGRLVPRRSRLRREAPRALRRQHQGPRRGRPSPTRRKGPARRRGLQLAPVPRLALAGAGARGPRAPRPERDGLAQPPPRAHRRGARCRRAPTSPPAPCPSGSASRASSSTSSTSSRRTAPTTRCSATSSAGNGDPPLCIFGARITPNQHKLVREFVLLDNTYCSGILSADGHQWSTTAIGTDYMESSFAGLPRSYPDGMGDDEADALAYSPAGFIWDNALRHGVRIRNYGEFMAPAVKWRDPRQEGHARLPRLLPHLEGRERRGGLRERPR